MSSSTHIYNGFDPIETIREIEQIKEEAEEECEKQNPDQEKLYKLMLKQFNVGLALSTAGSKGRMGSFRPF